MKNDIIEIGNIIKVILRDKDGNIVGQAITDKDNRKQIEDKRWHLTNAGYVIGYDDITRTKFTMHTYLKGAKDGKIVNHINGNKLDNRLDNLEHITYSLNSLLGKYPTTNKTGKKGVSIVKTKDGTIKYKAGIQYKKKTYHLGTYKTFKEAVDARQRKEIELIGKVIEY